MKTPAAAVMFVCVCRLALAADDLPAAASAKADLPTPYSPPCVEREDVFAFAEKPAVRKVGDDKYEITFAVKGNCDVTVGVVDGDGRVARHLGSGVLGANAPAPFQKNSLSQTIYWNGKDDLGEYVKEPGKHRVRVMLGLKPEFDKRLGGTSPKNLPGYAWGLAIGPDGVYVMMKGGGSHGHVTVRKFDHDGNYVMSLTPSPSSMPESKLAGLRFVEYEPGRKAIHGPNEHETISRDGIFLPIGGRRAADCQPVLIGNRLYFANMTPKGSSWVSTLQYIYTDGSTDVRGLEGIPLSDKLSHVNPCLAVSPDGKRLYLSRALGYEAEGTAPVVVTRNVDGMEPARMFVGKPGLLRGYIKGGYLPTAENTGFNSPQGVDCDAQERVYVCDNMNARLQIFSPDGQFLKTIPVDRPKLVRVHAKTGTIYVLHAARVQGQSINRLTKFESFANPAEVFHVDGLTAACFAVDSWTSKPRLWTAGESSWIDAGGASGSGPGIRIWEDEGGELKLLEDFDETARREAGPDYLGRWCGAGPVGNSKVVCDPKRERVYYGNCAFFDLVTGRKLGHLRLPGSIDDIAFDKQGYMHCHFNPGFFMQGVGRLDPDREFPFGLKDWENPLKFRWLTLSEVPYDYGVESKGWRGILPVRDQLGAKFFQDGIGVNMRGDVAENCNIYYAPKMEKEGDDFAFAGNVSNGGEGAQGNKYNDYKRHIDDMQKRGEEVYSIRRQPGVPALGATVWVFDRNGELREGGSMAVVGSLINSVMIDEDGATYFVNNRTRLCGDRAFLADRVGVYGDSSFKGSTFTGSLIKSRGKTRVLSSGAPVAMDRPPAGPAELSQYREKVWCEGAEWIYAGASPIVAGGCSCPTSRFHLDWYKRSYVPEAYRHSIGILDTSGNLIMHLGRYGNQDDAAGMKPGTGDIPMFMPRFIGGTDNYLCFEDWGERLVVLKLNYHAEETAGIE